MAITASMVKELRERTGAGMMECKKALTEADGDIEVAIENMRKSGQAKAAKKAGRTAADGVIVMAQDGAHAVMVEVNCETDFVAKDENFKSFANAVAERALNSDAVDVGALMALPLHEGEDTTIEEARQALVSKIVENMNVRRFARIQATGGNRTTKPVDRFWLNRRTRPHRFRKLSHFLANPPEPLALHDPIALSY